MIQATTGPGQNAVRFFDCDCAVGRQVIPQPGSYHSVHELLEEMDYFGIERALVYHVSARDHFPMEGNWRLLAELTGQVRLTPCWVVLPSHTGEAPAPDQLVSEMLSNGVRAARIYPAKRGHGWSLAGWSAGPLFTVLAAAHIPVFVAADQLTWDAVHAVATAYGGLPLVVTNVRYEELRNLYPLLAALPNLHIDISRLVVHYGLEALVARFGPRRLLFGTHMPTFSAGPALTHLLYAGITQAERELIAAGNLERLLACAGKPGGG
jgi:hypothetical protein